MRSIIANSIVVLTFLVAAVLSESSLYYHAVQEDGVLEWATFWAFVVAGVMYLGNAVRQLSRTAVLPWFACGLGLFCLIVALEEISWGQRLFGFQAPEYFLEENFQQEF